MEPSSTATTRIEVRIAADRLSASVRLVEPGEGGPPAEEEVVAALTEAGVVVTDDVREAVRRFLACASGEGEGNTDGAESQGSGAKSDGGRENEEASDEEGWFVVARGRPPVKARDERIAWAAELEEQKRAWEGEGIEDLYPVSKIVAVREGDVLGTIEPAVEPQPGEDVTGEPIEVEGRPVPLEIDGTIRRDEADPARLIAGADGRIVEEEHALRIEPVRLIEGDIDPKKPSTGIEDHVQIRGSVPDGAEVSSARDVTVEGVVEAARVRAGGDVVVRGGIVGRRSGSVCAGGEVIAKFCSEVELTVGNRVRVGTQLMGCRVFTGGEVHAPQAAVVGGIVFA
ncbi:MAG: DUF342 domain-containing protein, partial [Planctomycetota bacterium]